MRLQKELILFNFDHLPDSPRASVVIWDFGGDMGLRGQILDMEAFRELCRRAAIEKDADRLADIKEEIRIMVGAADIKVCQIRFEPATKPN